MKSSLSPCISWLSRGDLYSSRCAPGLRGVTLGGKELNSHPMSNSCCCVGVGSILFVGRFLPA